MMPTKNSSPAVPEVLVVLVIDGSYRMADDFPTILDSYLKGILKQLKQPILIEGEEKQSKDRISPNLKWGLVIFGYYRPYSEVPVEPRHFTSDFARFQEQLKNLEFKHGGMSRNAVAEGLVSAIEMFETHISKKKSDNPEPKKHCILVSNSEPLKDPVHCNFDERFDNFTLDQVCREMKNQNIHLSLITPDGSKPELEEIVKKVNVNKVETTEGVDPSHVLMFAGGIKSEGLNAQKRKREESVDPTNGTEQPPSKKPSLESTDKLEKSDQPLTIQPSRQSPKSSPASQTSRTRRTLNNQGSQSPHSPAAQHSPLPMVSSPLAMTPSASPVLTTPQISTPQTVPIPINVALPTTTQQIPIPRPVGIPQALLSLQPGRIPAAIPPEEQERFLINYKNNQLLLQNNQLKSELAHSQQNVLDKLIQSHISTGSSLSIQPPVQPTATVVGQLPRNPAMIPHIGNQQQVNPNQQLQLQLPQDQQKPQQQHRKPIWNGQITWKTTMGNTKNEQSCFVFAAAQKSPPSDYHLSLWPDKMEICALLPLAESQNDARSKKLPIVTFHPATASTIDKFTSLLSILEKKKTAACARFPNSPIPNTGIILFPGNNNCFVGALYLNIPFPLQQLQLQQQIQLQMQSQQQPSQGQQQQLFQMSQAQVAARMQQQHQQLQLMVQRLSSANPGMSRDEIINMIRKSQQPPSG